jgi:hypothetical protein
MFGRWGRDEAPGPKIYARGAQDHDEPRPERKKMTGGQIALGVLGILAGISILSHSNQDGQKAAALAAKPAVAVAQKAPGKRCGATLREYEALQIGITLGQAIGIIGCKGSEMSRVAYGGQETIMVSWPGEEGLFSNMNATFDNDRLVAKGQLGLE